MVVGKDQRACAGWSPDRYLASTPATIDNSEALLHSATSRPHCSIPTACTYATAANAAQQPGRGDPPPPPPTITCSSSCSAAPSSLMQRAKLPAATAAQTRAPSRWACDLASSLAGSSICKSDGALPWILSYAIDLWMHTTRSYLVAVAIATVLPSYVRAVLQTSLSSWNLNCSIP